MARFPFKAAERLTLGHLQSEVSNVLDQLWHRGLATGPLDGQDYAPPVELREEPARYVVTAEVPGIDPSVLEITASLASVTISGEKLSSPLPEDVPDDQCRIVQSERRYGSFKRVVPLPGPIATDAVLASLRDGVLEIVLPKAAESVQATVRVEVCSADEPKPSSSPSGEGL